MMIDQKIEEIVNNLINCWEEDTINLSFHDINHPCFSIIKILAERDDYIETVITTILRRMRKELTWSFVILWHIVPEEDRPVIPEEAKGKIQVLTDIWIAWGKEKGYLNE